MSEQQVIYAKDGIIDKEYLLVLSESAIYKVIIRKINKIDDDNITSVGISDERYPGQTINISAQTSLLEFDETMYQTAKNLRKKGENTNKLYNIGSKSNTKTKTKEKVSNMPQNKNPRSKVIDQYLASLESNEEPDYPKIVDLVIEAGRATKEDAKKIIFQAKLRYKWYTKDGKINPFSTKKSDV